MAATAEDTTIGSCKADQRRQWDSAAQELRTWWPAFEKFMAPASEAMLAAARLRPGAQVVDVATGFGEPALSVARRVGAGGRVVATDLSPAMLAVAAERARAGGLANVEFAVMDAEEPTLAEGRFDALTCRLGLMFLPHLDIALERLGQLLRPGGRLVAAVWGPAEANPWLWLALRALREFLELPAPPQDRSSVFALGAAGCLADELERAGLEEVRTAPVALQCSWPSAQAYTAYHRASPMRRWVAEEAAARQDQAWREVTAAALRHSGHGGLHLPGQVLVVAGTRPMVRRPFSRRSTDELRAWRRNPMP